MDKNKKIKKKRKEGEIGPADVSVIGVEALEKGNRPSPRNGDLWAPMRRAIARPLRSASIVRALKWLFGYNFS